MKSYLGKLVTYRAISVHAYHMTSGVSASDERTHYYWCVRHRRVETDGNVCAGVNHLGPYTTAKEAETAVQRIADREEQWEADDTRWRGEKA